MDEFEKRNRDKVREIFRSADRVDLKPSLLLKAKIMAEIERLDSRLSLKRWKWFAVLSPVAVAALFLIFFNFQQPSFDVSVNEQVLVKVEVRDIKDMNVAYAEIKLPDGVVFYSKNNPEIEKENSLTLAWESAVKNSHLPFVVMSASTGKKKIMIRFFDDMENLVREKSLRINFRDKA